MRYFTGPFGFWPFPIVNILLALADRIRMTTPYGYWSPPGVGYPQAPMSRRYEPAGTIYDVVRDEKGRLVRIVARQGG